MREGIQMPQDATRDGFATYDELRGPDLDAARWSPARLPLPTGGEHIPLDPNAELAVGEGEVRVTIPRFSLSHDTFQPVDSPKYLIFSTGRFELPADRPRPTDPEGRRCRPSWPAPRGSPPSPCPGAGAGRPRSAGPCRR